MAGKRTPVPSSPSNPRNSNTEDVSGRSTVGEKYYSQYIIMQLTSFNFTSCNGNFLLRVKIFCQSKSCIRYLGRVYHRPILLDINCVLRDKILKTYHDQLVECLIDENQRDKESEDLLREPGHVADEEGGLTGDNYNTDHTNPHPDP